MRGGHLLFPTKQSHVTRRLLRLRTSAPRSDIIHTENCCFARVHPHSLFTGPMKSTSCILFSHRRFSFRVSILFLSNPPPGAFRRSASERKNVKLNECVMRCKRSASPHWKTYESTAKRSLTRRTQRTQRISDKGFSFVPTCPRYLGVRDLCV